METSKNAKATSAFFRSFQELRAYFQMLPLTKRTRNPNKLKKQREQFLGRCKICHEPLCYISGTNILQCCSPACSGVTKRYGNSRQTTPFVRLLNAKGAEIAQTLFPASWKGNEKCNL